MSSSAGTSAPAAARPAARQAGMRAIGIDPETFMRENSAPGGLPGHCLGSAPSLIAAPTVAAADEAELHQALMDREAPRPDVD